MGAQKRLFFGDFRDKKWLFFSSEELRYSIWIAAGKEPCN
jgi:hypothetical protein